MKRIAGVTRLALAVAIVMTLFGVRVEAETVTFTLPTSYTDNTSIPAAKLAVMSTEVQYKIGPTGTFGAFGTAVNGATSLVAPYVTPAGSTSYWRARAISVADGNTIGPWSAEVPFVRAFPAPAAPAILNVQ